MRHRSQFLLVLLAVLSLHLLTDPGFLLVVYYIDLSLPILSLVA